MKQLKEKIEAIPGIDTALGEKIEKRLGQLTKPSGSLGRLEELAKWYGMARREVKPSLQNKVVTVFAADHGVVEENVSAYPQEVTAQMVYNFLRGGAGINVLARHVGAKVVVVDIGVAHEFPSLAGLRKNKVRWGTANMAKGPAMERSEAISAIEVGFNVVEGLLVEGIDLIGTGDMGIGNTTASSAITAVITGQALPSVTGKGTGIDDDRLRHKISVIEKALAQNQPDRNDPLDVLAKVGGLEIAGMVGVILNAALHQVPVLIDGFISGSAALIAVALQPRVKGYLLASHQSVEPGHRLALHWIGLEPVLDLNLRLGEGTGAALAMGLVEAGVKILDEMATFGEAGVSEKG